MLNESAMTNSVSSNIWIQSRQKKTKQQKHTNKELCTQGSSKPENVRQQKREARSAYFTKNSKNKKKKLKCSFLGFSLPYWSIVGDVVKSKRPLPWMYCMWLLPLDCNQQSCSLFCSRLSPALLFFLGVKDLKHQFIENIFSGPLWRKVSRRCRRPVSQESVWPPEEDLTHKPSIRNKRSFYVRPGARSNV